ncbi:CgeB family protein [Bacillus amyloliquefaciens]|uniref:CgeB family protein n=1 Tax=Bacillus amyloliquefaciens TaxID=1390 RepID=UPI003A846AF1
MKVLYIRSGYKGIYTYFDRWIEEGFLQSSVRFFSVSELSEDSIRSIRAFKPDISLMMAGDRIPSEWLQWLRTEQIPVYLWLTEDPFYFDVSKTIAPLADAVLTIEQNALDAYRQMGLQHVYYVPIPVNQRLFTKQAADASLHTNLLLIGYPYPNRVELVKAAAKLPYTLRIIGKGWRRHLPKKIARQQNVLIMDEWIEPEHAALHYNSTDVVLNPHRSYRFALNQNRSGIQNISLNTRIFDIAACQAFQLTDLSPAPPFSSFVSYSGLADFAEKIHFYMTNPREREQIAALNYQETVPAYTYDRIPAVLTAIRSKTFS